VISGGGAPRVLVVEDVQEIRRAFRGALEAAGYEVVTAEDEASASEAARTRPPALVVVCLPQPPLDAVEAGLRVRGQSPADGDVPLVIVPGTRSDLEGVDVHLGRNVYVSYLGSFEQLDRLMASLLSAAQARPF
jgi:CheY-like chemotaxis protein